MISKLREVLALKDDHALKVFLVGNAFPKAEANDLFQAAVVLRNASKYLEAFGVLQVLRKTPSGATFPNLDYLEGNLLLDLKRYSEAVSVYSRILSTQPSDIAHNNRGLAFRYSGERGRALEDYLAAIRINPHNDFAHRASGEIHEELGGLSAAKNAYEQAIGSNSRNADSHVGLARVLYKTEEWVAAYKQLLIARSINPDHAEANHAIAFIEEDFELTEPSENKPSTT
jgi:tetratricopeptide (TPR) repeat protein